MRRLLPALMAFPLLALLAIPSLASPRTVTGTWSSASSPAQPVYQTSAAFLKAKVYMPGGWKQGTQTAFDKMQILTTATNAWSIDNEAMPGGGLAQMAVCSDGSKISVVDGINSQGVVVSRLSIYDPTKPQGSRWSAGPAPTTKKDGSVYVRDTGCAWLGGRLYLFGGDASSSNGTINGITDVTLAFNPATGRWSNTGQNMPGKNWVFGYTSDGTSAYVLGGVDPHSNDLRVVWRFTPATGWTKLAKLPKPQGGSTGYEWPGAGMLGNKVAMFGGSSETRTLVCSLPCTALGSWKDGHRTLLIGRDDFGYASGGSTPTLYAVDGPGITTAEKTT